MGEQSEKASSGQPLSFWPPSVSMTWPSSSTWVEGIHWPERNGPHRYRQSFITVFIGKELENKLQLSHTQCVVNMRVSLCLSLSLSVCLSPQVSIGKLYETQRNIVEGVGPRWSSSWRGPGNGGGWNDGRWTRREERWGASSTEDQQEVTSPSCTADLFLQRVPAILLHCPERRPALPTRRGETSSDGRGLGTAKDFFFFGLNICLYINLLFFFLLGFWWLCT